MNYLQSDDQQKFADFLKAKLPDAVNYVPPTPSDDIWEGIQRKRLFADAEAVAAGRPVGIDALTGFDAQDALYTGLDASASVESRASAISAAPLPAKRWVISMRWAASIAAVFMVVGVGMGLFIEHKRLDPHAEVASVPVEDNNLPAQVAAEEHFAEVDQLMATFASVQNSDASDANNAQLEAEIGTWARSLLSTTQLLMDSPLGLDPQRRKLLSDVEMVLVQIAQLAPNQDPDDRQITERSIEESQVRERLQEATPSPSTKKKSYEGQRGL